jgi:hypothetical protein
MEISYDLVFLTQEILIAYLVLSKNSPMDEQVVLRKYNIGLAQKVLAFEERSGPQAGIDEGSRTPELTLSAKIISSIQKRRYLNVFKYSNSRVNEIVGHEKQVHLVFQKGKYRHSPSSPPSPPKIAMSERQLPLKIHNCY